MNRIKFSIITVTYNAIDYIEKAIQSVELQNYNNKEYIIIDGNSTDGTIDIIKRHKSNIKIFISEPDNGIYDAMNKGLNYADGDFVFFLGADDTFFNSNVLQSVANKITDLGSVYYGDAMMLPLNRILWGKYNKIKLGIGNICHQTIFYPKCIYKKYQYDKKYVLFADYVMNIKLYRKYNFIYLHETIAYYNQTGISSKRQDKEFEKNKIALIVNNLGIIPLVSRYIYHTLWKIKHGKILI